MNMVRIMSSDSITFVMSYDIAIQSKTLEIFLGDMVNGNRQDTNILHLPIHSKRLNRIIDFMNLKYSNSSTKPLLDFKIADEETMDLLEIASYLKIQTLTE